MSIKDLSNFGQHASGAVAKAEQASPPLPLPSDNSLRVDFNPLSETSPSSSASPWYGSQAETEHITTQLEDLRRRAAMPVPL